MMRTQKLDAMEVLNRDWTDALIVARIWGKLVYLEAKNVTNQINVPYQGNQRRVGHIIMNE